MRPFIANSFEAYLYFELRNTEGMKEEFIPSFLDKLDEYHRQAIFNAKLYVIDDYRGVKNTILILIMN